MYIVHVQASMASIHVVEPIILLYKNSIHWGKKNEIPDVYKEPAQCAREIILHIVGGKIRTAKSGSCHSHIDLTRDTKGPSINDVT